MQEPPRPGLAWLGNRPFGEREWTPQRKTRRSVGSAVTAHYREPPLNGLKYVQTVRRRKKAYLSWEMPSGCTNSLRWHNEKTLKVVQPLVGEFNLMAVGLSRDALTYESDRRLHLTYETSLSGRRANRTRPSRESRHRISPVRVIGADNEQIGIIETADVTWCRGPGLDLSSISRFPAAGLQIMDHGKHKYAAAKCQAESARKASERPEKVRRAL